MKAYTAIFNYYYSGKIKNNILLCLEKKEGNRMTIYPKITSDNLLNLYIMDSSAAKDEIIKILNKGDYNDSSVKTLNKLASRLNDVDSAELVRLFKNNSFINYI